MIRNGTRRPGRLRAVLAAWAAAVALSPALAAQETPPPPSPSSPPFALPLVERTLPNGLRVVVAEQHDIPLVAAHVVVRTGAEADPDSLGGLASLVAGLVPRGTQSRPGPQVTQALILQGTPSMAALADWDLSRVTALASASRFPAVRRSWPRACSVPPSRSRRCGTSVPFSRSGRRTASPTRPSWRSTPRRAWCTGPPRTGARSSGRQSRWPASPGTR
ncbi:MAG TPA: hypothetical protein VHG28_24420 [Longimicrobiaceae bacterium]|nr:hypothetical protein [Longimicrobiaceae bacterium]